MIAGAWWVKSWWVWLGWQVKLGQKRPIVHRPWQLPAFCDSLRRWQEKGVRLALGEGPVTPPPPNQPDWTRGGLQIAEITARSDTITSSAWAGESQKRVREHRSSHERRWVLTPSWFQTTELSEEARMDPAGLQFKCRCEWFQKSPLSCTQLL